MAHLARVRQNNFPKCVTGSLFIPTDGKEVYLKSSIKIVLEPRFTSGTERGARRPLWWLYYCQLSVLPSSFTKELLAFVAILAPVPEWLVSVSQQHRFEMLSPFSKLHLEKNYLADRNLLWTDETVVCVCLCVFLSVTHQFLSRLWIGCSFLCVATGPWWEGEEAGRLYWQTVTL